MAPSAYWLLIICNLIVQVCEKGVATTAPTSGQRPDENDEDVPDNSYSHYGYQEHPYYGYYLPIAKNEGKNVLEKDKQSDEYNVQHDNKTLTYNETVAKRKEITAEPEIIAERRIHGIFDYFKYVYGIEYTNKQGGYHVYNIKNFYQYTLPID